MEINRTNQRSITLWVISGVLILFLAVTSGLAWQLRKHLRRQIISRDGEVLMAVASMEVAQVRELNDGLFPPGADEELFEVALNTSEIKGVIGVRVFKEENKFVGAIPLALKRGQLAHADEEIMMGKRPVTRFHPDFVLSEIFLMVEDEEYEASVFPVLEIMIPLFALEDQSVLGFAQYFIDGTALASELSVLHRNVLTYAGGAFLFGAVLAGSILYWAFRKLRLVNNLLEDRTQNLISANHKLSMEARTAAIGAITSHLIHGLKSPLQGIRQFVTAQSSGDDSDSSEVIWQDAAATTERMQKLINEVMEILQDRGGEFSYEVTAAEICSLVEERVSFHAESGGVRLLVQGSEEAGDIQLSNDRANLVILILVNLLRNAIDASSNGDAVTLKLSAKDTNRISLEVIDQAGGLPGHVVENLFQPVSSSKTDGSGVGLSLCQELTRHLQGQLKLARTGPDGTVFCLTISSDS